MNKELCPFCNEQAIVATSTTTGCCDGERYYRGYITDIKDRSTIPCHYLAGLQKQKLFKEYVEQYSVGVFVELLEIKVGMDIVADLTAQTVKRIIHKEGTSLESFLTADNRFVRLFGQLLVKSNGFQKNNAEWFDVSGGLDPGLGDSAIMLQRIAFYLNKHRRESIVNLLQAEVQKRLGKCQGIYSLNPTYTPFSTVLVGPVRFVSASWAPDPYLGEIVESPTVLDTMIEFEHYLDAVKDYHHCFLESLHLVRNNNGVQHVSFGTGS